MATATAEFSVEPWDHGFALTASGVWEVETIGAVDARLRRLGEQSQNCELLINIDHVEAMDTAGAMVLRRTMDSCQSRTARSGFVGGSEVYRQLLDRAERHLAPCETEPPQTNPFLSVVERLGRGVADAYFEALDVLGFVGVVLTALGRTLRDPRRFRAVSTVYHMEKAGLDAVPIVGLMSFLIGAVVAYMGAKVLQQFGAEIFTVELIGIAVLREFGVMLTAILIAGRSGSAFTAQIGSMKLREEIDAIRTLGLDPIELLVLPRVLALLIMLPLLAFLSGILGLIGGALVAWSSMGISLSLFFYRTQEIIVLSNFWVGLIKAPFFAFIIAVIGCYQGLNVEGGAESVGARTTLSVVQSIFLVIVLDAFFAMFFLEIDF